MSAAVDSQVPAGAAGVVFYVDDDEDVRAFARSVLRKAGYQVLEAGSADEAARVLDAAEGRIDVLLMDINLPDAWGSTLAQSLRVNHPEMALVFTTGFAGSDDVLRGGLKDAVRVLAKPFGVDDLLSVIRSAILDPVGPPHGSKSKDPDSENQGRRGD